MEAQDTRLRAPVGAVVAAMAVIVAAWTAAGALGLLAEPLRIVVMWLFVGTGVLAVWPWPRQRDDVKAAILTSVPVVAVIAVALLLPAFLRTGPAYHVFCVAVVAALLARAMPGSGQAVMRVAAGAVLLLGVYQFAVETIPGLWILSDRIGAGLGGLATAVSGRTLAVGSTFAGLDFLVLMIGLIVGWLLLTPGHRLARGLLAVGVLCGIHLLYLGGLCFADDVLAALPEVTPPPPPDMYVPPDWEWVAAVRSLYPWNLPLLAAVLHAGIALAIFRWTTWPAAEASVGPQRQSLVRGPHAWMLWGSVALAVLVPLVATFCPAESALNGKRIVAYQQGYRVDWQTPQHGSYGQYSAGRFGMLPRFAASLGGEITIAPELTDEVLAAADVLMIVHPMDRWEREQLERIWAFVRRGGTLLVVAGPSMLDAGMSSSFNQVLQPTGMRVREDVAVARAPGWQQGLNNLAHPVSAGVDDRRRWFGTFDTSSIQVRWPARPIIVGRWGWSEPGSDAVLTEQARFEPGERLGDLVLAASQRLGKGRVMVLGGPAPLTNLGNVTQYPLTGRLLAAAANRGQANNPQVWWRQLLLVLGCAGLIVLAGRGVESLRLAVVAGLLMVVGAFGTSLSVWSSRVVPDGRLIADESTGLASAVAYVDATHLPAHLDEPWSYDGLAGFWLTLMRNGLMPLQMQDFHRDRLEGAGMLISAGPARAYRESHRKRIVEFVRGGGVLISMVGAEEAPASAALLDEFDLKMPKSPTRPWERKAEAEPLGEVATAYLDAADHGRGEYQVEVLFYTGWPVKAPVGSGGELLTVGAIDQPTITTMEDQKERVTFKQQPLVAARRFGRGWAVLIGDTNFALNKNLEYTGGETFRGRRENAHYWRWLITRVTDREEWVPPEPPPVELPEEALP